MQVQKKIVLIFLIAILTLSANCFLLFAYQAPTDKQKQEVKDKIDEGNKAKKEMEEAIEEVTKAGKDGAKAKEKAAAKKALDLLDKLKKLRQEAIILADKYYKPDATNVKGEPEYDPSIRGEGETSPDGKVKIGEEAFSDPGWLASTKLHEFAHADLAKNGTWPKTDKGVNMRECEAYDKEIENAEKSGFSKEQIDEVKKRRKSYYDALSDDNKKKVDKKDYDSSGVVPAGDAVKAGRVKIDFIGKGTAAGAIFKLKVTRITPEPFILEIPLGTPISPNTEGVQTMMVGNDISVPLTDKVTIIEVPGYCLNPLLLPPPTPKQIKEEGKPDPKWTIENPWENPDVYIVPKSIIQTGNKLSEEGKFHKDMPKEKYLQTVVQRAIWHEANPEKFNKEKLKSDIAEQVKESGGKQTPEQIENLTDNLWEDINLIKKESQKERPEFKKPKV